LSKAQVVPTHKTMAGHVEYMCRTADRNPPETDEKPPKYQLGMDMENGALGAI
jgi:hypothetical protein